MPKCLSINAESIENDGINISESLIGNLDDEDVSENAELVTFDMNKGIASGNSDHIFDLTKKAVNTLDNSSLRSLLNDVLSFYEKADRNIQIVVAAMWIKMRNLLAEGRKKLILRRLIQMTDLKSRYQKAWLTLSKHTKLCFCQNILLLQMLLGICRFRNLPDHKYWVRASSDSNERRK